MNEELSVSSLIEWSSPGGNRYALIVVTDNSEHHNSKDYRKLEVAKYDSEQETWETDHEIGPMGKVQSFGIPESIQD